MILATEMLSLTGGVEMTLEKCRLEDVVEVVAGKWKGSILWCLRERPVRFNELRRLLPGVTPTTLTRVLRELERDGLVLRKQFLEIPPRVEYSTTDLGSSLFSVFQAIDEWGQLQLDTVEQARGSFDSRQQAS